MEFNLREGQKICISYRFDVTYLFVKMVPKNDIASKFLKNHRCQVYLSELCLDFQKITYQEFLFLTASKAIMYLFFTNV